MAYRRTVGTGVTGAIVLLASLLAIFLVVGISTGIGDLPIPLSTTFFAVTNRLGWSGVEPHS